MQKIGGPNGQPQWLQGQHVLKIVQARSFKERLLGLHAWQSWGPDPRGLLFSNCSSVHTLGLAQGIDIISFNKSLHIIDIYVSFSTNKFYYKPRAKHILELPANYCSGIYWRNQIEFAMQKINL